MSHHFEAGGISEGLEGTLEGTAAITAIANRIAALPRTGASEENAQALALEFLNRVKPALERATVDVIGFAHLWKSVSIRLASLAQEGDRPEGRTELRAGLALIRDDVARRVSAAHAAGQAAAAFAAQVAALRERHAIANDAPAREQLATALGAFAAAASSAATAVERWRCAWEDLGQRVNDAIARVDHGEPGFAAWLSSQIDAADLEWRRAEKLARERQSGALL